VKTFKQQANRSSGTLPEDNLRMFVAALFSALHVLTLALGAGALFARGRALSGSLDEAGWKRLLAADNAWGIAALLWITTGLARVFFGGKEPAFYWRNGFFWIKLSLFALIFLLELTPMITFIRVRGARRRGLPAPLFPQDAYRRINTLEGMLLIAIVFSASFMARGAWLF